MDEKGPGYKGNLVTAMRLTHVKQRDLAALVGLSAPQFCLMLNGKKREFRPDEQLRISIALGIYDTSWLFAAVEIPPDARRPAPGDRHAEADEPAS